MSGTRPPAMHPEASAAPTLRQAWTVAGWGLAFWGAAQLAAAVLARNATAASAIQAVLAEWGAGRVGVAWSDPLAPVPTWKIVARRAGLGAALGAGAAALVIVVALTTGGAATAKATPAPGLLAVGLVIAVLSAVRDELLLRGVVLRATSALLPVWAVLLACGAAGAAARLGTDRTLGLVLLVEALRGVALGALWVRDRGAWMPVAANAAWTWCLGSVVRGGLLDVRFATDADSGMPALVVLAAGAAVALVAILRPGARSTSSRPD